MPRSCCSSWACVISPHLQVPVALDKPRRKQPKGEEGTIAHKADHPQVLHQLSPSHLVGTQNQHQVLGTHQPPEGHPPVNLPRMPLRQFQHHRVLLHSSPHGLPISFSGDNNFVTILWEGRLPVVTGNSADSILVAPADILLAAANTLHVHIWGGDQVQTWLVVFGDVKAMSHQTLLHKVFTTQGPGCTPSHGVLLCFLSLPYHWL